MSGIVSGTLKAGVKLADVIATATGRQLNRLGSKLGMDKDMLKGMNENQIKSAIMDEGQKYIKNMRKNQNRRTGAAFYGGLGATGAAYGVSDFIGDMLGIKKMGDGTLKADKVKKKKNNSTKPNGADPKGLMKPKKNTVEPFKKKVEQPKKKPNIPPKAPPTRPKKAEDMKKKTTQLYMKEKNTGKDSNVKFNSRGGMLKKGRR